LVPRTDAIASGLWPTPQTAYDGRTDEAWTEAKARAAAKHAAGEYASGTGAPGMMDLQRAVRMRQWPTPTSNDYRNAGYQSANGRDYLTLPGAVGAAPPRGGWPTPTSRDYRSGKNINCWDNARPLSEVVGGTLNPTWVEWLMGFPLGWTDCGASGTRSSRKSRNGSAAG
jgi:hypothetical protein